MNIIKKLLKASPIVSIEKNKVYVLQVPNNINEAEILELSAWILEVKQKYGIEIIFITEDLKFINIPKGYELTKIKKS